MSLQGRHGAGGRPGRRVRRVARVHQAMPCKSSAAEQRDRRVGGPDSRCGHNGPRP